MNSKAGGAWNLPCVQLFGMKIEVPKRRQLPTYSVAADSAAIGGVWSNVKICPAAA